MKNLVLLFIVFMTTCEQRQQELRVSVSNDTNLERSRETVTVSWQQLEEIMGAVTATDFIGHVIVTDAEGIEIPSQVIYKDDKTPQGLIFQSSVPAHGTAYYYLKSGQPTVFPPQEWLKTTKGEQSKPQNPLKVLVEQKMYKL
ncbi:hypothetical protein FACS1894195_5520 [Bacteroidia bacterium]|nr:hypothetical protein FACS1894195_5520 [Bacteroidia bacterium]